MRFITLTLLCLIACLTNAGEAKTIRDLFASEPNNIFMLLSNRTRLDMLDYFDSGQKVAASNRLSGNDTSSQLIDVTENSISLQLTDATRIDMLLYKQGNDSVVAVVRTALLPAPDSQIAFYDPNWNLLSKTKIFEEPALNDFIVPFSFVIGKFFFFFFPFPTYVVRNHKFLIFQGIELLPSFLCLYWT